VRFSIKLLLLAAAVLVVVVASRWLLLRSTELRPLRRSKMRRSTAGNREFRFLPASRGEKTYRSSSAASARCKAYNTVTVKSRVDGNIVEAAFTEGQYVHQDEPWPEYLYHRLSGRARRDT
jgi:hypothetical protein